MYENNVIGAVFSRTTPDEIYFVVDLEKTENRPVERGEYVGFSLFGRPAIGIVTAIERINEEIIESLASSPAAVARMRELAMEPGAEKLVAAVRVQGYVEESGRVVRPRFPALPGTLVYRDPNEELQRALGTGQITIGKLLANPDVDVKLNVPALISRHFSVLAVTGAGKSYTVSVILDQIMRNFPNASIVVIDPHEDYFFFKRNPDYGSRVELFTPAGRNGTRRLRFKVRNFSINELSEIAGIPSNATHQLAMFEQVYRELESQPGTPDWDFNDVRNRLAQIAADQSLNARDVANAFSIYRRLRNIPEEIFLDKTVETELYNEVTPCLAKPGQMTVIGTGLLPRRAKEALVSQVLKRIFNGAVAWRQGLDEPKLAGPVLVVIEEAHQFAPPDRTYCKDIITQIAGEGRKFGVGLGIISQRPGKLDENVLSQCNTQIILKITNPKDQNAIINASEHMSGELMNDLPGLNTGEAIITGSAIGLPSMVRVNPIGMPPGGDDVDILGMWASQETIEEEILEVEPANDLEDIL